MGDAGELGKVMAIKAKAVMFVVKATARGGVKKEDLEKFEKLNEDLKLILEERERYKGVSDQRLQSYFSEAEALKMQIDNTLKLFKENFHIDKDGWYVDKNGKRS